MIYGLNNGMVMQRDRNNRCRIRLQTDAEITELLCFDEKNAPVPVAYEDGILSGIPTGGPYSLMINGALFRDLYVGDLWILAGQSNMEGNGILTEADTRYQSDPRIRAFYMNDEWRPARNPMHHTGRAVDRVHTAIYHSLDQPRGVGAGPGLAFACKMFACTGVPQGLIPCAHGGTIQEHWIPETRDLGGEQSLYGAMFRRFQKNGSHIRGIFWYQGCSDGEKIREQYYKERCIHLFSCMREDLGTLRDTADPLPIVQVQIGRWTDEFSQEGEEHDRCWTSIRRQQSEIGETLPAIDTLAAITYRTDDQVHLQSEAQWNLGERAAEAMLNLIDPGEAVVQGALPAMKIGRVSLRPVSVYPEYTEMILEVENAHGDLRAFPRAMGFVLAEEPDRPDAWRLPYDAFTEGSRIHVRFRMPVDALCRYYLYYGYGCDPACNITDENGAPVPCFGPIAIKKYRDTVQKPECPCEELPECWMPPSPD